MLKQVSLRLADPGLFSGCGRRHDAKITVVDCKELETGGMILLLQVDGRIDDELVADLGRTPGVRHVYSGGVGAESGLVMLMLNMPLFCDVVRSAGCLCISCPFSSGRAGISDWDLLVRDASELKKCTDLLEGNGFPIQIKRVSEPARAGRLVQRRRELVH